MTPTFSPHWDRIARRSVRTGDISPLKRGREIELAVMRLVQWPELIQQLWEEEQEVKGQTGMLHFLADYVRAGVPAVVEHTDPVLFKNLTSGMSRLRQLGWHQRLRPGPLRARAAERRRRNAALRQ